MDELGREVDWTAARPPPGKELSGGFVPLRTVELGDAEALFEAGRDPAIWTYLPYGPFGTRAAFGARMGQMLGWADPLYFAVCPDGAEAQGIASYLRIDTDHGSIEIG